MTRLVLLLLPLLMGCGSAYMGRSVVASTYTGSPARIFLVSQFRGGSATSVERFHVKLGEKFRQCKVALVGVLPVDAEQPDLRDRIDQAALHANADSVLYLKLALIPGINGKPGQQRYGLTLRDMALATDVWQGEGAVELADALNDGRVNEDFARQIVQAMVNAHVIKTCPVGPQGPRS